jgi:hypothetical protein
MNDPEADRIGVYKLGALFSESGWLFREQFVKDCGIDAQVEVKENDKPTGQLIAIQIKSGESYFSESDDNTITYRPDTKHIEYWLRYDCQSSSYYLTRLRTNSIGHQYQKTR